MDGPKRVDCRTMTRHNNIESNKVRQWMTMELVAKDRIPFDFQIPWLIQFPTHYSNDCPKLSINGRLSSIVTSLRHMKMLIVVGDE
jgi:hypothetical protein